MNLILKRFGEWVTDLRADHFRAAVLRLTALYTAGVFVIVCAFSFLVYGLFTTGVAERLNEVDDRIELMQEGEETLFEEVSHNLFDIIVLSDSILLFLTILVSNLIAQKTLAPLEESYLRQKRFVADAAHELRTPLAVMKTGGEVLLRHERTPEQYAQYARESLEEVEKLITLSNDLLFLAEQEEAPQETDLFSLSEVCVKQSEQVRSYAEAKHVTLHTTIDPEICLAGRREDLSRLVLNLLKNAVDYNKPEGNVLLSLSHEKEGAVLMVKDTGIGIAEEDIPHIFERFFKADSSRTEKRTSGSGLGLAIVKEITDKQGGTIHIESSLGEGTTFTLRFPCA